MEYIIRLSEKGYYGNIPYTPVEKEKAIVFKSMKDARRNLNRINGWLMKDGNAEIETI